MEKRDGHLVVDEVDIALYIREDLLVQVIRGTKWRKRDNNIACNASMLVSERSHASADMQSICTMHGADMSVAFWHLPEANLRHALGDTARTMCMSGLGKR